MTRPPRPDGTADGGVPHDAWLREALRHAPDADAAPPPALSDAILRAARAEAAAEGTARPVPATTPTSFLQRLLAAWAWLARPPVAAGFASLMVATVVGLMWWDRPLDEAMAPREAPVASSSQAPAAEPAPAPQVQPTPPAAAVPPAAVTPAPEATPRPREARPSPAPSARETQARQRAAQEQRDAALRERREELAARTQEAERRTAAAADSAIGSSTPAAGAAPPTTPAEAKSDSAFATADRGGAPAAKAERRTAAIAAAPTPAPLRQDAPRRPVVGPLGLLRATIATEPERWSWQRDAGATTPMNTPVMQWLQRVGETARGRWTPLGDRTETAALAARGTTVVLRRDGAVHTTLRLADDAVEVIDASASSPRQRAGLPAPEATALRLELDQATR